MDTLEHMGTSAMEGMVVTDMHIQAIILKSRKVKRNGGENGLRSNKGSY